MRLHSEIRRRPVDLFLETERGALRPLPEHPYDTAHVETVSANRFIFVEKRRNALLINDPE